MTSVKKLTRVVAGLKKVWTGRLVGSKARSFTLLGVMVLVLGVIVVSAAYSFTHRQTAQAAACQSAATGNWSAAGSWTGCGGVAPTSADSVAILTGHTITLDADPTILTIDVQNGGILTNNGIAHTLTLAGTSGTLFTLGASGTFTPSTFISVVMNPDAAVTLTSGTITFNNLTLSPTITVARIYTFGAGALTIDGNFNINPTAASALALTVNMGAGITVGATKTTTITRTTSATSNLDTTATNYALSTGKLDIAAGGTLTANGSTITLTGTTGTLFTKVGTFNAGTSTVVMNPDASLTLTSGAITFNNLTLNPTITANRAYAFGGGALTVNGDLNINPNAASALTLTVNLGADTIVAAGKTITVQRSGSASAKLRSSPNLAAQVGSGLSVTNTYLPALAALNGTDVAFIDYTNDQLRTYRFDGTNWVQVGNSLSVTNTGYPALAALNGTDVAFIDYTNRQLRTYRFDGTNWVQVGNSLSVTNTSYPALAALNGTDVAFIDSINQQLRTYRFDGTNWAQVGNSLSVTSTDLPALAALNGTDVAFIDSTNDQLRTYRFDGTNWVQVGNSLSVTNTYLPALAALNGTDVAFIDSTNDQLRTYRFDGTNWVQVGNSLSVTNTYLPALAALNGTDVAFIDSTNDQLRTYRFSVTNSTAGRLVIQTGGVFDAFSSTVTLNGATGTLLTNSGTFTAGTSTVVMNPDAAVTLTSGTVTFNNLTLSPLITVARTYTFGAGALTIDGDFNINPDAGSALALTVNMGAGITVGATKTTTVTRTNSATANFNTTVTNYALSTGKLDIATGGTLTANGSTITLTGTDGTPFSTLTGTFTAGTSTFVYSGNNGGGNTTVRATTYYNLTVNNAAETYVLAGTTTTGSDLTITAGILDTVTGQNYGLTVGGNYSNSGTFTARNGLVTLNGTTTQTLSGTLTGASAFYDLTVTNASGASATDCERTGFTASVDFNAAATATNNLTFTTANTRVEFNSGSTYTFNNINWNGQAAGTRIYFRNSAAAGTWLLNVSGTQTAVTFINVSRSNASSGSAIAVTVSTSTDCGSNTNWSFNANPNVPSTLGPAGLVGGGYTADNTPTPTFTLSDSDGADTVRFQIQIDDTANFSSVLVDYTSALQAQGATSFTVGQALGGGTYTTGSAGQTLTDLSFYWRVKAIDAAAAESAWSTANGGNVAFIVDATVPTVPGIPATASPTVDTTPTWTWTASTDASSGLHSSSPYGLQYSLSSTFASGVSTTTSSTNSYTQPTALADGVWYIRVRANDALDQQSAYSSNGSVVIAAGGPGFVTGLSSTDHGSSTWSNDNTISMSWTSASGGSVGLSGYSYLFDTNSGTVPDTTLDIGVVTTVSSGALADGSSHYFHIRARDGIGTWGATVHSPPYFVDTTAPSVIALSTISPTTNTAPTWTWAASDALSGLSGSYAVQWSKDSAFSSSVSSATSSTTSFTHSTALSLGTWYLRVQATDTAGNSAYSEVGTVVIDPPAGGAIAAASGTSSSSSGSSSATNSSSNKKTAVPKEAEVTVEEKQSQSDQTPATKEKVDKVAGLMDLKMTIKDRGRPLVGANVELRSEPRYGTTDQNGVVEFKQVEPGQHTLSITYGGRTAQTLVLIGASNSTDSVQTLAVSFENTPLYKQRSAWVGIVVAMLLGLVPALIVRRRRSRQ